MSRYDIEAMFSQAGEDRDPVLLMYCKDLAIWHFIVIANPNISIEFQEMRYNLAIKELEKIQSGKVVPYNWPLADAAETPNTFFHVASNPRRVTNY